jgi:DNA replication regulator SLD3
LGSFCMDLLIPFYKSRIPEKTVQIIKRFGGSSSSPNKKTIEAKKVKDKDAKAVDKKLKRPLARSASQSQINPLSRAVSLSRSLTETSMPHIKREPSEARSIMSIAAPDKPKHRRRDSMASLKHLKSRQISLSSLAAPKDRKRKHELGEDELRNAINAIKKPNRSMIGRQVADEREQLKSSNPSGSRSKAQLSGERKALGGVENVQVMATPHHNRIKHMYISSAGAAVLDEVVLGSSAVKPESREQMQARDIGSSHFHRHILETPTKGSARHLVLGSPMKLANDFDGVPGSTVKRTGYTAASMMNAETVITSSPLVLSTKPDRIYRTYAFGRAPSQNPGSTSPLASRRLTVIPATPVKRSAA